MKMKETAYEDEFALRRISITACCTLNKSSPYTVLCDMVVRFLHLFFLGNRCNADADASLDPVGNVRASKNYKVI